MKKYNCGLIEIKNVEQGNEEDLEVYFNIFDVRIAKEEIDLLLRY